MKYLYSIITVFLTISGFSQTSPSTGACPPAGCTDLYSAAYFDPSTIVGPSSIGCNCGPISFFQEFTIIEGTEITCVCFQIERLSGGGLTTYSINVYSFNSADVLNIANISAETAVASGSYAMTGAEPDGAVICVDMGTAGALEPGDDMFVVEFLDPLGTFSHAATGGSPGTDTYIYAPAAGVPEIELMVDVAFPSDLLLEVNGCVEDVMAAPLVPTMGEWGLIILALLFLITALVAVRARVLSKVA